MTSFHIWFEQIITCSRILCFIIILVFISDSSFLFNLLFRSYSDLIFGFDTLFASSLYISSSVRFFLHCIIIVTMFTVGIFRSMAHDIFYTCCILYMRAWVLIIGYLGLVSLHFYHPNLRYVLSLKTTLRPWHHTLCLIALMWEIFGIDSGTFCSWWTRSYGMALHWGIAILESFFFFIGWPLCRGILFLVDAGFLSHVHSLEDIKCPFSHWSMRHDQYISSGVLYTGAYPFSVDDGF